MYNAFSLQKDLVEVGQRMYNRGYVASNDGNISARIDEERIVVTPTGVSKGFMKPDMMVIIDMDGKVLNGDRKASSEVFMHLEVYKNRPDVMSVCHAHPPYATAYAVVGKPLDKCILPEVIISFGSIPIVKYGTPGTDELYKPLIPLLKDHEAFLLANHGALTIGKDVLSTYYKMETIEHFAHISFIAQQIGNANILKGDEVEKLLEQRRKFGVTTTAGCNSCSLDSNYNISSNSKNDKINFHDLSDNEKEELVSKIASSLLKELL